MVGNCEEFLLLIAAAILVVVAGALLDDHSKQQHVVVVIADFCFVFVIFDFVSNFDLIPSTHSII